MALAIARLAILGLAVLSVSYSENSDSEVDPMVPWYPISGNTAIN